MTDNDQIKALVTSVFSLKRFLYNKNNLMYITLHVLPKLLIFLRDDKRCRMGLVDMYVDQNSDGNYDIVYTLKNFAANTELAVRTEIKNKAVSVTSIFPNASTLECEIYDMYGIFFSDNDDLRRTLTDPATIAGFPMQKDFPFYGTAAAVYNKESGLIDIREITENEYDT